jgi:hypothetical protein
MYTVVDCLVNGTTYKVGQMIVLASQHNNHQVYYTIIFLILFPCINVYFDLSGMHDRPRQWTEGEKGTGPSQKKKGTGPSHLSPARRGEPHQIWCARARKERTTREPDRNVGGEEGERGGQRDYPVAFPFLGRLVFVSLPH